MIQILAIYGLENSDQLNGWLSVAAQEEVAAYVAIVGEILALYLEE